MPSRAPCRRVRLCGRRVGKAKPAVEPSLWRRILGFLEGQQRDLTARRAALVRERRDADKARAKLREEVARYDLGGGDQQGGSEEEVVDAEFSEVDEDAKN